MNALVRAWNWVLKRWMRLPLPEYAPLPPTAAAKPPRPKRPKANGHDSFGSFYFRETILDQLDHYFVVLGRMKRGDSDSYKYFSRIGGHILPLRSLHEEVSLEVIKLSGWCLDTLPMTGGVFFGDADMEKEETEKKVMIPRAVYFTKFKPTAGPIQVQPVSEGSIYKMTVYWDKPNDPQWNKQVGEKGVVQNYPVVVLPDGTVRVLRMLTTEFRSVRAKHGRDRGSQFRVPNRAWGIPECYREWAEEHKTPVEAFLRAIFIHSVEAFAWASNAAMTRIAVKKDSLTGVFAVDIERTSYFFKDRSVTINSRGARRPIFHIVRAHERRITSNRQTAVRTHFRGERQFDWNGYGIAITVPGWHHLDIAEVNISAIDGESEEYKTAKASGKKMIGTGKLAKTMLGWIERGIGGVDGKWNKDA